MSIRTIVISLLVGICLGVTGTLLYTDRFQIIAERSGTPRAETNAEQKNATTPLPAPDGSANDYPEIVYRIDKKEPSSIVVWFSSAPIPETGSELQICLTSAKDEIIICDDVAPGQRTGKFYVISSLPIENAKAVLLIRE